MNRRGVQHVSGSLLTISTLANLSHNHTAMKHSCEAHLGKAKAGFNLSKKQQGPGRPSLGS
eukprot:2992431-Amphidinium_carterae.2